MGNYEKSELFPVAAEERGAHFASSSGVESLNHAMLGGDYKVRYQSPSSLLLPLAQDMAQRYEKNRQEALAAQDLCGLGLVKRVVLDLQNTGILEPGTGNFTQQVIAASRKYFYCLLLIGQVYVFTYRGETLDSMSLHPFPLLS